MGLTVWQRAQWWFLDNAEDELSALGGGNPDAGLRWLYRHGVTATHTKLADGQTEENEGFPRELRARCAALGILDMVHGGWQQCRVDAPGDADKANGLIDREQLDYWIASGEFEWKGAPQSREWDRLGVYFNRLGAEDGGGPLLNTGRIAFCTMPNEPAGQSFDWAAVKRLKLRWLPECYPNEFPAMPGQWPDQAFPVGASLGKPLCHPALGMYLPDGGVKVTVEAYLASLRRARLLGFTYGFSVYGSALTGADWDALAAAVGRAGTRSALAWRP